MPVWLSEALARLADDPVLQGVLAALSTFVLEDPTTVGCGLLVADQRMAYSTALVALSVGIALGDLGLYAAGRALGPVAQIRGLISPERFGRAAGWFRHNLVVAVILSRFVPGMRLTTYVAAGVLRAPVVRFAAVVVGASLVWTFLLLTVTVRLGEAVLPALGRMRWPVAAAALVALVLLQRGVARRVGRGGDAGRTPGDEPAARAEVSGQMSSPDEAPVTSSFELWPPWLFYIPVAAYYAWLALRHRSLMLPSIANPSVYSGGLIGESKSEILDLVTGEARRWILPYVVVERPMDDSAIPAAVEAACSSLEAAGLSFPIVAKPDVGQRGAGVQPVHEVRELEDYLRVFPGGQRVVLQRMAGLGTAGACSGRDRGAAREAGVLFWRLPPSQPISISSMTLKVFPTVQGDGRKTLRQLIDADPRARRLRDVYHQRHSENLDRVLTQGEVLPLVFAGNHCQGAVFLDGTDMVTDAVSRRVEEIVASMPEFYFGRVDVCFDDLEAFLAGTDLQVVEINAAGAEATHIWDASTTLVQAYATLFEQWRTLFAIGDANRRRGHRPMPLRRFLADVIAYRRLARSYPEAA